MRLIKAMGKELHPVWQGKLVRWLLTAVLSFVVAGVFVPVCLALLPDSVERSLSDGAVALLVLGAGSCLCALVLWRTASRERA
ncbi:hypothetical protein OG607_19790 [Streptomyces sp. NBC_01537]|uniref:hypothetical protein n=1 Tax=Streptomyces sp. NBC_01537 TaxID=2903896 RepID=UPI0038668B55